MNDQWQDNLRSRMEQHEEPAPEGLWESIEQLMPSDNKHHLWGKRTVAIVAAAAAVALLFIVLFTTNRSEEQIQYAEQTSTQIENSREETLGVYKNELQKESQILAANKHSFDGSDELIASKKIEVIADSNEETALLEKQTEEATKSDTRLKETKKESFGITTEASETTQLFVTSSVSQDQFHSQSQSGSKWQTNLSMSNIPSASTQTYSGYGTFVTQETVEEQYGFMSKYTRQEVYTNVEHEQPITFGLTLRYNLNKKWNIASGLTYSLLKSQLRSGGDNYHYDDRQTLHYIGVPINIAYNFWQSNNLSSYISAGTHVQKNIAGTLSSNYYIDEQLELNTKEKVLSKKLQWSVNSAIGIEYRVSDFIGIYAEPGIDYYFKNSSELETVYKDRPFSFNLRLGVRLNINQ